jgi:hypothetical protein
MENNFIIKKTLLLIHEDGKALDKFVEEYYHFFVRNMDRIGNNMLQITSSIDVAEARELIPEGRLVVLECDNDEKELTLDDVLDKINSNTFGIETLDFNEKMVLYSASKNIS